MNELDIKRLLKSSSRNIKIGELSAEVISALGLDLKPQNINVWSARIQEHCEKHKNEYESVANYNQAVKSIPLIIQNPDYVSIHEKSGNIQYIKRLNEISLVGIKIIKGNSGLLFRTIFPITEDKLEHNIRTGKYISLK